MPGELISSPGSGSSLLVTLDEATCPFCASVFLTLGVRPPEDLQTMEAPGHIFREWDFSVPWDRVAQDLLTSPRQL